MIAFKKILAVEGRALCINALPQLDGRARYTLWGLHVKPTLLMCDEQVFVISACQLGPAARPVSQPGHGPNTIDGFCHCEYNLPFQFYARLIHVQRDHILALCHCEYN